MDYFTEKFGFESDKLDAVTEELATVLNIVPEHRFSDSYGGDVSLFEKASAPEESLLLYYNHSGDISGSYVHEEDFPELGLILLIQQKGKHVDFEPKLRRMERFKPILLYRSQYEPETKNDDVQFDLAKERSKSKL